MTAKFDEIKFLPPQKQEKKISLNLKQIVTPPPAPKPIPMPKPIVSPPLVKPLVKKKVEPVVEVPEVKKIILDEKKRTFATKSVKENNVTKVVKNPVKKVVKKKVKKPKKMVKKKSIKKKRIVKRHPKGISSQAQGKPVKHRAKRSNNSLLANMLMATGTSLNVKPTRRSSNAGAYGERMIKKLYGSTFNTYTQTQKKFIEHNLNAIQYITQKTLIENGLPSVAIRTHQKGINIVSFYLHPNGDISKLRLKKRIGYEALDNNTLEVIRIAYKDYPLPKQTTTIIFYVYY